MASIGVVGILAFVVYLIGRYARRPQKAVAGRAGGAAGRAALQDRPQWFEYLLALLLLAAVTAVAAWQLVGSQLLAASDWRGDDRALLFFIVMLAVAALGLAAFLIYLAAQAVERRRIERRAFAATGAETAAPAAAEVQETPSPLRLFGLLLFAVGFLLLNWIYVPATLQHVLMLSMIYPVSLAAVLVLLFDKATRTWSTKGAAETTREWLFCDAVGLLLVLGFLNLYQAAAAESYVALFWDVLFVVLSLLAFWLVDRQRTRLRFLVGYGYFILLPILLLIWRTVQGVAVPETVSWWATIWPFFGLAVVFFALEAMTLLIPSSAERQGLPALKDAIFFLLYAILLSAALPPAAA